MYIYSWSGSMYRFAKKKFCHAYSNAPKPTSRSPPHFWKIVRYFS